MNSEGKTSLCHLCLVIAACLAVSISLTAQVNTATTETRGMPTQQATIERGEVVYVSGNDLVVKMSDGELRHFSNIPETARATVDGKELSIHELKPGMQLTRTTIVSTTPKTITTVQTVTGKVWNVMPPNSVVLTLTVDGQEVDIWGVKKGMVLSATKINEEPVTEAQQQARVSGTAPAPPPPPPAEAPILIAQAEPAPVPVAEPEVLPKTSSPVPLFGLLGLLLTASSLGLRLFRS